jgi:hypothetical protein
MPLQILRAKDFLIDAMPPQKPSILWRHKTEDLAIEASGVHIICFDDPKKGVRLSLQIACEVATSKKQYAPTRGVNPFTGINESEEYDKMLARDAGNMNVLYINTLAAPTRLEEEISEVLPEMDQWVWQGRDKGAAFPYPDLPLNILHARAGTLTKDEGRKELFNYIKQNKVDLVVINSFEFASRTQREKDDMVHLLKDLCDERGVSIVVFTHESEKRLIAGASRRGPIGSLSILSNFVSTVKAMAEELYVPGVCETEEDEVYAGCDVVQNQYLDPGEVQTILMQAEAPPRKHVRDDGTITEQRFEVCRNGLGDDVVRKDGVKIVK